MQTPMRTTPSAQVHALGIVHELLTQEPSLRGCVTVTVGPLGVPTYTVLDGLASAERSERVRLIARRYGLPEPSVVDSARLESRDPTRCIVSTVWQVAP
jgi:hypothetical protein